MTKKKKTEPFFTRGAYIALCIALLVSVFGYNSTYFYWVLNDHKEVDRSITDLCFSEKELTVATDYKGWTTEIISGFEFTLPNDTKVTQDELQVHFDCKLFEMGIHKLKRGDGKRNKRSKYFQKMREFAKVTSKDISYRGGWGDTSEKINFLKEKQQFFQDTADGYFFELKRIKGMVTRQKDGKYVCYLFATNDAHMFGATFLFKTTDQTIIDQTLITFLNGVTFPHAPVLADDKSCPISQ